MKHIQRRFRRKAWLIQLYLMNHWQTLTLLLLAFILGFVIAVEILVGKYSSVNSGRRGEAKLAVVEVYAEEKKPVIIWQGTASYYSRKGCLGCSKDLRMANGQILADENLTVAFNKTKLNSKVKITNVKNSQSVIATVTDRGGFERLGRIIDLTVATKNAINCSDLCSVTVEAINFF